MRGVDNTIRPTTGSLGEHSLRFQMAGLVAPDALQDIEVEIHFSDIVGAAIKRYPFIYWD